MRRLETILREDSARANLALPNPEGPTPLFILPPDDPDLAAAVTRILLAHGADAGWRNANGRHRSTSRAIRISTRRQRWWKRASLAVTGELCSWRDLLRCWPRRVGLGSAALRDRCGTSPGGRPRSDQRGPRPLAAHEHDAPGEARHGCDDLKVLADRGYFSGEEILACEQAGATPYVPRPLTSGAKADGRSARRTSSISATRTHTAAPPARCFPTV